MKHIQIRNSDMAWHIAANIQFPPNFDESKQYPAIISVHPFGSCKEQTSGNIYGKALAEKGYVVLAYDASFQGESGGEPRWIEDPTQRVEDISRVIDYAVTLPYVDAKRIGVLGVCGGGGYAINAALTEKRIKAVVSITGVNIGRLFLRRFQQLRSDWRIECNGVATNQRGSWWRITDQRITSRQPGCSKSPWTDRTRCL